MTQPNDQVGRQAASQPAKPANQPTNLKLLPYFTIRWK